MQNFFYKSFIVGLLSTSTALAAPTKDLYRNYAELSAHQTEGTDYNVVATDRGNSITVLAIHGGRIEAGSDDAARLLAGTDWNLYTFIATKPEHNRALHLTSTHFDEPRALALVGRSEECVSLHGFALAEAIPLACIGGGNQTLAKAVYNSLKAQAPAIKLEYPCTRFGGSDPENILNRCKHQGVQIEMSPELRDRLQSDSGLAGQFKAAVRQALTTTH